jgi:hypothetical protein
MGYSSSSDVTEPPAAQLSGFLPRIPVREGNIGSQTTVRKVRPSQNRFSVPSPFQVLQRKLVMNRKSLKQIAFDAFSR